MHAHIHRHPHPHAYMCACKSVQAHTCTHTHTVKKKQGWHLRTSVTLPQFQSQRASRERHQDRDHTMPGKPAERKPEKRV